MGSIYCEYRDTSAFAEVQIDYVNFSTVQKNFLINYSDPIKHCKKCNGAIKYVYPNQSTMENTFFTIYNCID